MLALVPSEGGPLRASQIHELQLARDDVIEAPPLINRLQRDCEYGMGAGAGVVQQMGGDYFVPNALVKELQHLSLLLALVDEQVLDLELVLLRPPNTQRCWLARL